MGCSEVRGSVVNRWWLLWPGHPGTSNQVQRLDVQVEQGLSKNSELIRKPTEFICDGISQEGALE
jgi:hypothetical protein